MKRKNTWSTSLRFNLDDNVYKTAFDNLKGMDKKRYKSVCHVIAVAVNEYFDRQRRLDVDPYFETRQRENQFCDSIVEMVGKSLEKAMPVFMATYLMNHAAVLPEFPVSPVKKPGKTADAADDDFIDLNFAT